MSLVGDPIPPRPAYFGPDGAPPGIAVDLDAYGDDWVASRPRISPRVGVVHTNGGPGEGTISGALAVANSKYNATHPHYNLNAPQPTKHLRTDLRSIANSTPKHIERLYGEIDCSFWTISYETADRGYSNGGSTDLGDFLYDHDELLARAIAYDSIVHNIPIIVPVVWNAAGFVTHTAPFDGVYTIYKGKSCPGTTKKNRVLHGDILPRAREIRAAWTDTTPTPTPGDDMETIEPFSWLEDQQLNANTTYEFDAPLGVVAFGGNFTVVGANLVGWVTAWGNGDEPPNTSTVRILPGPGNDNYGRVKAGPDGKIRIRATRPCRLYVDVQAVQR
jgi:hypothetical protein